MHVQVTLANVMCIAAGCGYYYRVIVRSLGPACSQAPASAGMISQLSQCRLDWIRPDVTAGHLHTAMTVQGISGSPLHDTEETGASGARPWGTPPQPVALTRAGRADWPWLQAAVQMAWRSCGYLPSESGQADTRGAWATMPRVATRTPTPATRSIAMARAFTLRTMERWGIDTRGADAAAVVTELLTNALRHALPQLPDDSSPLSAWPIRLGLADPGPYVICAVADPSADLPAPRHPEWQDEAGRGLLVVASLSDHWGCCAAPADQGKVVWAAFAARTRSR
jgi:hypothetical protein